ncbi:MAG: hypothetical protein AMQ22_02206 [Candidatus Methanofastidiosum methylothiophilum]|uniref:Uncharacterized protein n=1 Tax=Candidatus Methanofastidiosum methylothiophilum TaxID=1705564 RepID=A0A150IKP3_9EURY|nr:MAG: hypothetical protein AMQ22_02206 [Candidatus Methanofastidiosum methylthiophilus]
MTVPATPSFEHCAVPQYKLKSFHWLSELMPEGKIISILYFGFVPIVTQLTDARPKRVPPEASTIVTFGEL